MKFSTTRFGGKETQRNETLFTLGNGNIGFRGDTDERAGSFHKGTYINGFFESEPILYGESAYGYAQNHETIVNLPDPKVIEMTINGKPFSSDGKSCLTTDTDEGTLTRTTAWQSENDKVEVESVRLVSFKRQDCAAIRYTVTNTGESDIEINLKSFIDTQAKNILAEDDPRIGAKFRHLPLSVKADKELCQSFYAVTEKSKLALAGCTLQKIKREGKEENFLGEKTFTLNKGESFCLEKYISFNWNKISLESQEELTKKNSSSCKEIFEAGFETLLSEQKEFLADFWNLADIQIEGDKASEEALKFNLFHLLQSASQNSRASIAAKGLTSEGYEGHFFWDSESYACPLFTYTAPKIAKSLLEYRASILSKAEDRAKTMSLKGALFPWRTIDGEETSAYFPAGTAQYHIDADIIFALDKYLNAHEEDTGFGKNSSKSEIEQMCAQTARMWQSLGHFNKNKKGAFCIEDVTGPDEYTAIVNNNAFTNLMARENLEIAVKRAGSAASQEEKDEWKNIAEKIYIPYDKESGIYPQDDSFLDKADWDFEGTPKENYPLLLHYHPLVIYRHRVLKQPDLVLAQFLLSGRFTRAEKIRNYNFYEKYTTGDSSLSHCIMSIMAAKCGMKGKALDYFNKTVRMDIDDVNGNSRDGIHTACMAGSWMSIVYGFAGFSDYKGNYSFEPELPAAWKKLKFSLSLKACILDVTLTQEQAEYSLREGKELNLCHRNINFTLKEKEKKVFGIKPKLEAILFDLDGVITNTAPLHYQAWKEMADKEGLLFNEDMNKKLLGISREASLDVILKENNVTWTEEKKSATCFSKNERYKELLKGLSEKDILLGIKSLLDAALQSGIKCALASSSKNAPAIIKALGLESYFCKQKEAENVFAKPEADIFLLAAESADVWYSNCIGLEDAKAGIQAIKACGMKAVGLKSSGDDVSKADLVLDSTEEVTLKKLQEAFNEKI